MKELTRAVRDRSGHTRCSALGLGGPVQPPSDGSSGLPGGSGCKSPTRISGQDNSLREAQTETAWKEACAVERANARYIRWHIATRVPTMLLIAAGILWWTPELWHRLWDGPDGSAGTPWYLPTLWLGLPQAYLAGVLLAKWDARRISQDFERLVMEAKCRQPAGEPTTDPEGGKEKEVA